MAGSEIRGPDLSGVIADADAAGLEYVVIGGFAVIAHGFFRATRDSDLLVPDGPATDEAILRFFERIGATRFSDGSVLGMEDVVGAHHLRVDSRHGVIDIMRGGLPPLDYETVAARAKDGVWRDRHFRVASLRSLVGFKRLAGRGQDRVDLEKLEERQRQAAGRPDPQPRRRLSPAHTPRAPGVPGRERSPIREPAGFRNSTHP